MLLFVLVDVCGCVVMLGVVLCVYFDEYEYVVGFVYYEIEFVVVYCYVCGDEFQIVMFEKLLCVLFECGVDWFGLCCVGKVVV